MKNVIKTTVVTKSSINRALSILRRLKKKTLEEQISYLTINMIHKNSYDEELALLRGVQRKKDDWSVLKTTYSYQNTLLFWSEEKTKILISYKRDLEGYRKMFSMEHDTYLDPEITLVLPEDLFVIMKWLQLIV